MNQPTTNTPMATQVDASMEMQFAAEWYFAYGSNLCIDQLAARIGPIGQGDDRPRLARLPDHRLVFNMQGDDGQVYANVERPGEGVIGVVYRCAPAALDKLDAHEWGYERRRVLVTDDSGNTLEAIAYVAKPDCIANTGKPTAAYLERVLRGARRHCLPEEYIRALEESQRTTNEAVTQPAPPAPQ